MSDEWGPWIAHDGKGCPCKGKWVHMIYSHPVNPKTHFGNGNFLPDGSVIGIANGGKSWKWEHGFKKIIRYRIRKPRALLDMIERARELSDDKLGELEAI